jgi:LPS export ABC transporter protein LptC
MKYVFIILATLVVLSCQESDLKKMGALQTDILPDEVSRDVHLVYSDSGRVKFIIDAPLIHKYIKDTVYTEFPEGVHAQFYAKDGSKTSDLVAGYALKVKTDDEIIFRKNVIFSNDKDETLLSEEIYLINDTIYSDTVVDIKTPAYVIKGIGLVAPKDFSTYRLLNPVGTVYAKEGEGF